MPREHHGFMLGARTLSLYGPDTDEAFGHLGFTNVSMWADPRRELYLNTPNYQLPLLTLGREQARIAGAWMRANLGFEFDAAFCADFVLATGRSIRG